MTKNIPHLILDESNTTRIARHPFGIYRESLVDDPLPLNEVIHKLEDIVVPFGKGFLNVLLAKFLSAC